MFSILHYSSLEHTVVINIKKSFFVIFHLMEKILYILPYIQNGGKSLIVHSMSKNLLF